MNITIDNEFRTLIPPLTGEEFDQLESNCIENGIQDSLKTWRGILIDGHNRYEIAKEHGLEFKTEEMEFSSRDDVKLWIIKNQLGRRNLSAYDRSVLALKLKPMIAEKAKEQQGTRTDICQKSDKSIDTKKELAKVAGVSHDTIHKVDVIENSDNDEVKQAVRNKEMSIDKAYREVKGLPPKKPKPKIEEPVVEEPLPFEEKVEFIETEISNEEVEDVAKDSSDTFSKLMIDELKSNISRLVGMDKFYRTDVVEQIRKLDVSDSEKEDVRRHVHSCLKWLAHVETGLIGW